MDIAIALIPALAWGINLSLLDWHLLNVFS